MAKPEHCFGAEYAKLSTLKNQHSSIVPAWQAFSQIRGIARSASQWNPECVLTLLLYSTMLDVQYCTVSQRQQLLRITLGPTAGVAVLSTSSYQVGAGAGRQFITMHTILECRETRGFDTSLAQIYFSPCRPSTIFKQLGKCRF